MPRVKGNGEINRQRTEDFLGIEIILHDTVIMDTFITHLSKPTDYVTPRVNPKVNCGLQVITMHRFKDFNKCTTMCNMLIVWEVGKIQVIFFFFFLPSYTVNLRLL